MQKQNPFPPSPAMTGAGLYQSRNFAFYEIDGKRLLTEVRFQISLDHSRLSPAISPRQVFSPVVVP
jgi:hypothetical protein